MDAVQFSGEVTRFDPGFGGLFTYRLYSAPDEQTARAFLRGQHVTGQFDYVVVKYPTGYRGKDHNTEFDASLLVKRDGLTW